MYADRRSTGRGIDPRSATIALAINGAVVAALILAAPEVLRIPHDPPLIVYPVPIPPPPAPLPPSRPVTRARPAPHPPVLPDPVVTSTPKSDPGLITFPSLPPMTSDGTGTATGTATATPIPTPTPPPVLVEPQLDPRYVHDLQPDYPAEETRASREGRVVVRVLIGVDGRVRQVERDSATSDAFWRATQRQALAHWRFRPATRGGVPEEAWRTMAISFVLRE